MDTDISACRSQKSTAVICTVIRESQRANHAVMEIRTTALPVMTLRAFIC